VEMEQLGMGFGISAGWVRGWFSFLVVQKLLLTQNLKKTKERKKKIKWKNRALGWSRCLYKRSVLSIR
jgi:hypothetical protein